MDEIPSFDHLTDIRLSVIGRLPYDAKERSENPTDARLATGLATATGHGPLFIRSEVP